MAALQELNRLLSERAASAETRAEAAITRAARLQRAYDTDVPRGQTHDLVELLEQRLKDGVTADRLAFLLREAQVARRCESQTETKRIAVHTAVTPTSPATAAFGKNQITVMVEGSPIRKADGRTDALFDPGQPVTVRFLRIGRDVGKLEGRLPLSHALVAGDREYRFTVKGTSDRAGSGLVELTAQNCAYP